MPGGDDPDENIALVLFEEGSIARWHTAAQAETVRESDHSRKIYNPALVATAHKVALSDTDLGDKNMLYAETHEWIVVEETTGTVGISDLAQKELGKIVHVELPKVGANLTVGCEAAVLESSKAATDIYSPVSGTVIEINESLREEPHLINSSPHHRGWLYKIALSSPSELSSLLDEANYRLET